MKLLLPTMMMMLTMKMAQSLGQNLGATGLDSLGNKISEGLGKSGNISEGLGKLGDKLVTSSEKLGDKLVAASEKLGKELGKGISDGLGSLAKGLVGGCVVMAVAIARVEIWNTGVLAFAKLVGAKGLIGSALKVAMFAPAAVFCVSVYVIALTELVGFIGRSNMADAVWWWW